MKFVLEDQLRGKTIYQDSILNKKFHSDQKWVTDSQIHNRCDSSGARCTVLIPSWLVVTRRVPRLWLRFFASRRWEFQLKLILQRIRKTPILIENSQLRLVGSLMWSRVKGGFRMVWQRILDWRMRSGLVTTTACI